MKRKGLLAVTAAAALSLVASLVTTTSASAAVNCDPYAGYKSMKGKTVTIFTSILEPELTTLNTCLLYTSPSPRDRQKSRMPSSA